MQFEPTPQQRAVEVSARAFAREVLAPAAAELDRVGGFPKAALAEAARRGLLGVAVSPALGGLGAGAVAYALAVLQTAVACASTTVALCVSNMVAEVVERFGTPAQAARWVPMLTAGRCIVGAFALSEPGAGSDPASMRARAERTSTGWRLAGEKLWITSGSDAGLFVVWARTGERGISCFLVPGDATGLHRGRPEAKMGLHGSTTTALTLQDVELEADALLGPLDRGLQVAMMALDGGRIGIGAQAVGIGKAALAEACRDAPDRRADLADAACRLQAAEALVLRAAWRKQEGLPFTREASMAKLTASEAAVAACEAALQVLGPDGFRRSLPVERFYRDARVTTIYEGTSEIQRVVIARAIARQGEAGAGR